MKSDSSAELRFAMQCYVHTALQSPQCTKLEFLKYYYLQMLQ